MFAIRQTNWFLEFLADHRFHRDRHWAPAAGAYAERVFRRDRRIGGSNIVGQTGLDPPLVGAPAPDPFLDLLPIQIVLKGLFGQLHHLVIVGEAQSDELVLSKLVNLRMPFLRRERLQAQALFEADHAILYLDRILTHAEKQKDRGDR